MATYTVVWVIEVEASNPREAAIEARDIQMDVSNLATVYQVTSERGKTTVVDLGSPRRRR